MDITIAGNTSLAHYCVNKLCRDGYRVKDIIVPGKGHSRTIDIADFSKLAGEFDLNLIKVPVLNGGHQIIDTDLLVSLEWPINLELPVKPKIASLVSNLAGQYSGTNLLDVAADIYLGKDRIEVQLLLDESRPNGRGIDEIILEPPFFKVLGYSEFELTPMDDLRCTKTKAAANLWMLLKKLIAKLSQSGNLPKPLKREMSFSKANVERVIDWHKGAVYLHNFIRAFTHPGPGAYTWYDDNRLYIWRGHYFDLSGQAPNALGQGHDDIEPGTIVDVVEEVGIVVKTSHGLFLITRIQAAGMPELPAWVWAGDAHIVANDKFQIINKNELINAR